MRPATLLAGLLALGLLAGVQAAAASTIFYITGSGAVDTIAPDGTALPSTQALLTGTVTFTTIGSPDTLFDGGKAASGVFWVTSVYHLSWSGPNAGSLDSSPVAGADWLQDSTAVFNNDPIGGAGDTPIDQLQQDNESSHTDAAFVATKNVSLFRQTTRTDWLNSTAYPETAGLAPGDLFEATNLLSIGVQNLAHDSVFDTYTYLPGSYVGSFFLQSMTEVTAVPEPDTFILFGLGLAALAGRWRRRTAA